MIETSTVAVDDLTTGWVDFAMMPWLREPGKQYAWYTHTAGNHEIAKTTNNSFPHGTAGKSLDGIWAQGSIMEDYSFQELVARFRNNRTVAEFETISLAGGMTELQLVYQSLEAGQSQIVWEIKADGMDEFILIDGREDNALANLPPAIRLRATFVGTPDIAPIMVLDANAVCIVGRMHSTMQAVSKLLAFLEPTDTLQIIVNMDAFDAARHTCTPKVILPDNSIVLADSITATQDPSKPTRNQIRRQLHAGRSSDGRSHADRCHDRQQNICALCAGRTDQRLLRITTMPKQTYEPDIYYDVRLERPVEVGPFKHLPRDKLQMKGATLNRIVDQGDGNAIATAQPAQMTI